MALARFYLLAREESGNASNVEAFMWFQFRLAIILLMLTGFVANALAEDQNQGAAEGRRQVLTGKERLGPKWSDEQRIDNCRVPIDKRGTKPRSSVCQNAPSS